MSRRLPPGLLAGLTGVALVASLSASRPAPVQSSSDTFATRQDGAAGSAVVLQVSPSGLPRLRPGVGHGVDVSVKNQKMTTVVLDAVEVEVTQVRSPRASEAQPCTLADFRTRAGRFEPIALGPGESISLSEAGVPARDWPQIEMVESGVDQDGCQASELQLAFRVVGAAQ